MVLTLSRQFVTLTGTGKAVRVFFFVILTFFLLSPSHLFESRPTFLSLLSSTFLRAYFVFYPSRYFVLSLRYPSAGTALSFQQQCILSTLPCVQRDSNIRHQVATACFTRGPSDVGSSEFNRLLLQRPPNDTLRH